MSVTILFSLDFLQGSKVYVVCMYTLKHIHRWYLFIYIYVVCIYIYIWVCVYVYMFIVESNEYWHSWRRVNNNYLVVEQKRRVRYDEGHQEGRNVRIIRRTERRVTCMRFENSFDSTKFFKPDIVIVITIFRCNDSRKKSK